MKLMHIYVFIAKKMPGLGAQLYCSSLTNVIAGLTSNPPVIMKTWGSRIKSGMTALELRRS